MNIPTTIITLPRLAVILTVPVFPRKTNKTPKAITVGPAMRLKVESLIPSGLGSYLTKVGGEGCGGAGACNLEHPYPGKAFIAAGMAVFGSSGAGQVLPGPARDLQPSSALSARRHDVR